MKRSLTVRSAIGLTVWLILAAMVFSIQGFYSPSASVFGSYHTQVYDASEWNGNNQATAKYKHATLTTPVLAPGTYRVGVTYLWLRSTDDEVGMELRVNDDPTDVVIYAFERHQGSAVLQRQRSTAWSYWTTTTKNAQTFDFYHWQDGGTGTHTVSSSAIEFWRVQ